MALGIIDERTDKFAAYFVVFMFVRWSIPATDLFGKKTSELQRWSFVISSQVKVLLIVAELSWTYSEDHRLWDCHAILTTFERTSLFYFINGIACHFYLENVGKKIMLQSYPDFSCKVASRAYIRYQVTAKRASSYQLMVLRGQRNTFVGLYSLSKRSLI